MQPDAPREAPRSVGDYALLEKIADGGMGSVYKGRSRATGQVVAIKLLAPRPGQGQEALLKRFEQEYRLASKLDHPHLVRALDFGVEGGTPYLAMEFVDGITLADRIERQGPLAESEAVRLISQVAQALDLAHARGLVHRDVKPENVLLAATGEAKLADLGLAKEAEGGHHLTRTGTGLGTPNFMAPEQFRDAKHADPRCDVYSLAATLYMAVTGALPFAGVGPVDIFTRKLRDDLDLPRRLASALSERANWAIRRALAADPRRRTATCREFIEDLTGRRILEAGPGVFAEEAPRELWFLVYTDGAGEVQTAKGSVNAVRRLLTQRLLKGARGARVGPSESGPFEPLLAHPEFRDLVLPAPRPARSAQDTPAAARATSPLAPLPSAEARSRPMSSAGALAEAAFGGREGAVPALWVWLAVAVLAVGAFAFGLYFLPH